MKDTRLRVYDKQNKKMLIFDPLAVCCDGDYGGNDYWWVNDNDDIQIQVPDIHKKDLYSDPMHPTSLKDKHGKEIYEGDIIQFESLFSQRELKNNRGRTSKVYWSGGGFYVWATKTPIAISPTINREVIGNISENPDLLGEPASSTPVKPENE